MRLILVCKKPIKEVYKPSPGPSRNIYFCDFEIEQ